MPKPVLMTVDDDPEVLRAIERDLRSHNSSKSKHATKHFYATKHPIVRSQEPGENWMWCYVDEVMFEED